MSTILTIASVLSPPVLNNLLADAQRNVLSAVKQQIIDWNNVIKSNYMTAFQNWCISFTNGHVTADTAPKPPAGYILGYFTDPTTGPGSVGPYGETPIEWAYPALGTEPVCPMPALPGTAEHPAGVMLIGTQNPAAPEWFNAQYHDATPVGTIAVGTSQDGIAGLFQKFGGVAGYGYFKKIG